MQPLRGGLAPLTLATKAAGNGLLNNLVAYWGLDEAGGANNALDKHSNGLTLTQVSSPGSATGIVYAGARTFDGGADYFTRASETLLQIGDSDWTIAAWLYLTTSAICDFVSKSNVAGSDAAWYIGSSGTNYRFVVRKADNSATVVNTGAAITQNAWKLLIAYHDAANDVTGICVDAGSVTTQAIAGGIRNGTAAMMIGARPEGTPSAFFAGRMGPVAMWKSASGGGGVLTAAQRTALYNAGAGLAYSAFTS